ncbi:ADP-ribosylglycohydrolase family protein [Glaciihabitans sp. GrIS 2.15]|uniref:ADP-ribosylglycohydrolase family protein n=1 Tax=Glaciihabitans sp. GrIS 2.15 TaxID=3071710 RepID=UPI002E082169|nr:ADP-ribosylglycohydrolase [Glaciihabitans sp. GrIS 2.15]
MTQRDRAVGALYGLAIGDALGMPTQLMSRTGIAERYGVIDRFRAADAWHPLAGGLPAGHITDDTEQALLLARLLIEGHGHVAPGIFARALVEWEDDMRARGSLDLLGPSTKRAVQAVLDGEPLATAGRFGTTNGAAMRVTPVGILRTWQPTDIFVDLVAETSFVSHNTGVAIAGAAAVAAAVSAGIDGANLEGAVEAAVEAAQIGAKRGYWIAAADVASRIRLAIDLADPADVDGSLTRLYEIVGTSLATQESVPAVFGILATFPDDPWSAVCSAASLGGDSDTVAAMAGAIGGALHGTAGFPAEARETVATVNSLDLEPVADRLLEFR